jgi:hypothetical protein
MRASISRRAADRRCRYRPAVACATVMELGFDAVLLNTAVAGAADPVAMAAAFAKRHRCGPQAFGAGMLEPRDMAVPSTPVIGRRCLHEARSFLPDRRQRRLDRPAGAARRKAGATAHQGKTVPALRAAIRRAKGDLRCASMPADRQRLLAAGDRGGLRFRASRPGGSGRRRSWCHSRRRSQARSIDP